MAEVQFRVEYVWLQSTQRTQHDFSPCPHCGLLSPWAAAALTAATSRKVTGKTAAPEPTAFLPWKTAGLLCSARQVSGALDVTLGTLNRNRLFSHSPTFSNLQTLLKTQASRKVTGTKAPTVCFQEGCARILPASAKAITLDCYKIKSFPS